MPSLRHVRQHATSEAGQSIVVVALFLLVLLGSAALVLDVGDWYLTKRRAQAAADAGATAAAQKLPDDPGAAVTIGKSYVNKNLSIASGTVTTNYKGNPLQAAVDVQLSAPSFFSHLFGIHTVTIRAHAAARRQPGTEHYAIFSYSDDCGRGIAWPGSGTTVEGGVHSNSSFTMNGSNNHLGTTTFGGTSSCAWVDTGSGSTYGGNPAGNRDVLHRPWPEPFDKASIPCDFSATSFSWTHNGVTIPSGTYCATNQIAVPASNITGRVTFIAPKVTVSGSGETFTPYYKDLFIFHTGTTDFNIAGSNDNLTGTIFVPNARLGLSGSNTSSYNLFLEGLYVSISGSGWNLHGTGPNTGWAGTELFE